MAATLESVTWSEAVNGDALVDLVENHGVKASVLPQAVVDRLREATLDTLETEAAKDPMVKKVHESTWLSRPSTIAGRQSAKVRGTR